MTEFTEPLWVIGDLGQLESSPGGAIVFPEPTGGNAMGPSGFHGGTSKFDMRYTFLKDLVTGYTGRIPAFLDGQKSLALDAIPMRASFTNLVSAQPTTSGTSMTLASAAANGFALNIPIIPLTGVMGSYGTATTATNAPLVIDFGFGVGATTANTSAVTVTDSTLYRVGDPIIIANALTTTTPLLTNVVSITSGTVVTVANNPGVTTSLTQIGSGFPWGPSEFASGGANSPYPVPIAHMPYIAFGPGLFMDPRQSIARAVVIQTAQSASSGSLTVTGWDVFWAPITDTISITSVTAVGGTFGVTTKTFKAISSIVPAITDSHNWSAGVSDVFGLPWKTDRAEHATVWWAGIQMVSTTGFTVPDFTSPATALTGDVRGTVFVGTIGTGTGYAGAQSSGTMASVAGGVTGGRLTVFATLSTWGQLNAKLTTPQWQAGRTQA